MTEANEAWVSGSRTLSRHPLLVALAKQEQARICQKRDDSVRENIFVGWGYKTSGQWARREAMRQSARYMLFEDAFIRSVKPGYGEGALYGIVKDTRGIYYDRDGKSDLVDILTDLPAEIPVETSELMDAYLASGASKYNWYTDEFNEQALDDQMPVPGVLLVDQTLGDASLPSGDSRGLFARMLEAALSDYPDLPIYVRGHPDHLLSGKKSCFPEGLMSDARVQCLSSSLAPWQAFSRAEAVYTISSLLGLEAVIHGKKVVSFAPSFYSGWGLTDDRHSIKRPKEYRLSREQLFYAAYMRYPIYFDPDTGERSDLARILAHVKLQKSRFKENARTHIVHGIPSFKQPVISRFLRSPGGNLNFVTGAKSILPGREDDDPIHVCWGSNQLPDAVREQSVLRVEDGFIRSAGLGSDLRPPWSLVFDDLGIYYDPVRPSRLESIILEGAFTGEILAEAQRIMDCLIEKKLSKYNLSSGEDAAWPPSSGTRILVPGQVESDASIKLGSPITSNLEFLEKVRAQNPDALIAYKPHPDIVHSLRPGMPETDKIRACADLVVRSTDIVPWLESCDELHTLTSLSGFEALLRGKKVVCYGQPFYAGWGVTEDHMPIPRRRISRTPVELAAAAFLMYPCYVNPDTGEFTTAWYVLQKLGAGDNQDRRTSYMRFVARAKQFKENVRRLLQRSL